MAGKTPAGQINRNVGKKGISYNAMLTKESVPSNAFKPPSVKGTQSTGLSRAQSKLH